MRGGSSMATRGPKGKLNKERQTIIIEAIEEGTPHDTAAALAGIGKTAFYDWLKKGEETESGKYYKFYSAVKQAEATAEAKRIERINKAGEDGDWKADAWYLERRYPEKWGRRVISADVNHSGEVTERHEYEATIEITQQLQADPEGRELLKKLWEWEQRTNRERAQV
jgi:transposase